MADTQRLYSAILALLADNTTGAISPQDIRDATETLRNGHGELSITSSAATTIVTQNTWYNVAGTYALTADASNWDMNTNGQLRYIGAAERCIHCALTFSFTGQGNNDVYEWGMGKNGAIVTPSIVRHKLNVGTDTRGSAAHGFTTVGMNDYITIMVRNTTDADDPTMVTGNLFVMDMPCGD